MEITKEQFDAYEAVRQSGVTNMFDTRVVSELSDLDKETIRVIMTNYGKLRDKFAE